MIRNEPLTAIIPARGGSKGVPKKNLYRIDGETLVERAIRLARQSGRVDRVLVTTDDPEIYAIAKAHDAAPPSLRPSALATDDARTIDAVQHLIAGQYRFRSIGLAAASGCRTIDLWCLRLCWPAPRT